MRKHLTWFRFALVYVALAAIPGCGGGHESDSPDAESAAHRVLGFSGAGYLNLRDTEKVREFLDTMDYESEDEFHEDIIGHMATLGGDMARVEFFYTGQGSFEGQTELFAKMAAEGFELYGGIQPIPPVEALDDDFEEALAALVRQHPEITVWQIGNEPDLLWEDHTRFPTFFLRAQPVIRETCPTCEVMLAGISNQYDSSEDNFQRYDSFLETIAAADLPGPAFDVFDFHYYKEGPDPDEIELAVQDYRDLLQRHDLEAGMSFWCTETGVYSGDPRDMEFGLKTEDEQARDLAREVAWMGAAGVERIFFWTVVEGWGNGTDFFEHMGLVYNGLGGDPPGAAGTTKKAYKTYQLLANSLHSITSVTRLAPGAYRFDGVDETAFIVWDEDATGSVTLRDLELSAVRVRGLVPDDHGVSLDTEQVVESTGAVTIEVDDLPLLLTLPAGS